MGWDLRGLVFHPGGLQASFWHKHLYAADGSASAWRPGFWPREDALQIQQLALAFLNFCDSFSAAESSLFLFIA